MHPVVEPRPRRARKGRLVKLVRSTGIVNERFYLERNPDVKQAGVDAVTHFVIDGWRRRLPPNATVEAWLRRTIAIRYVMKSLFGTPTPVLLQLMQEEIINSARRGPLARTRLNKVLVDFADRKANRQTISEMTRFVSLFPNTSPFNVHLLRGPEEVEIAEPRILNRAAQEGGRRQVSAPARWLATVTDASVYASFQVVAKGLFVHYEPAAHPGYDFVAGQALHAAGVKGAEGDVLTYARYAEHEKIESGILVSGRCSPNYFHTLVEYTSKSVIVNDCKIPLDVPVIIHDETFPQNLELLELVFPGRRIVHHGKGKRLDVGTLYIPSIPTFIPDTLELPLWMGAALDVEQLLAFRTLALGALGLQEAPAPRRRLFLRRNSVRSVLNSRELEEKLSALGFESVDPATLSIREQIEHFQSAKIIVSPYGAALSNVLFCQPGTIVVGLSSPSAVSFPLFDSLARVAGAEFWAYSGIQDGYDPDRMTLQMFHGDFTVPAQDFVAYLSRLL